MVASVDSAARICRQSPVGELWRLPCAALAAPFVLSGLSKAFDFAGATAEVRALTGFEPAWVGAVAVIAAQLGGAALLLGGGRWTRYGALLLALFVAVATLLAHSWWTKAGIDRVRDFNAFWEHIAIIGGLGLAAMIVGRRPHKSI